jgi:uncharacterized membrane protein
MDHEFSTNDSMERSHSERRDASISHTGKLVRRLRDSITHPDLSLHPRLIGPGASLLIAAFATDIAYAKTLLFQWSNFSIWLLSGGLLVGAFAAVALLLDFALHRITAISWPRFAGLVAAALLSLLNVFVHSRDGLTAVVPEGLALSAVVSAILVIVGWRGWSVGVRHSSRPVISKETHS